ncbi:MAG: 1,4-dihydroxy-2-naphthoate polyprenyltransferase, partial [Ilumatobacteraceae bacterium]
MNIWVQGARPRTLPAAVVPVAVGTALCVGEGDARWWRAILALGVSLLLQIGVNFANDYSDGVRGTDATRIGPTRLTASGLVSPSRVKRAALLGFAAAAVLGLVLALVTSLWLLVVGAAALLAGWFYTGGKHPYGYFGLGELFVFVFFGLVATVGTVFVISERIPALAWVLGAAIGALACALLVVNNLRDIPTDSKVGKRTLAVRLGDQRTRHLYVFLVIAALGSSAAGALWNPGCLAVLAAIPVAIAPISSVRSGVTGAGLIEVLGRTGRLQLVV